MLSQSLTVCFSSLSKINVVITQLWLRDKQTQWRVRWARTEGNKEEAQSHSRKWEEQSPWRGAREPRGPSLRCHLWWSLFQEISPFVWDYATAAEVTACVDQCGKGEISWRKSFPQREEWFPIQGSSTLKAFFHTKKVSSMITTCIQHNFFIHLTFKAFINSVSNPIVQNFLHFLARMCKYKFLET